MVLVQDTAEAKGRATLFAVTDPNADSRLKDGVVLGDRITDVKFQDDSDGRLGRIVTISADQDLEVYDRDGKLVTSPDIYFSDDAKRMVLVSDLAQAKGRATLYAINDDAADQKLKTGVVLRDGVTDVRFQAGPDGGTSRIMAVFQDPQGQQKISLFDGNGNPDAGGAGGSQASANQVQPPEESPDPGSPTGGAVVF